MVADTAEFWACPPGNTAFRSQDVSYFIDKFCSVMDNFGKTIDYQRIVNKVNQKMRNAPPIKYTEGRVRHNVKLVSYFEGALTSDVRFTDDPSCLTNRSKMLLKLIIPTMVFLLLTVPLTVHYLYERPNMSATQYNSNITTCDFGGSWKQNTDGSFSCHCYNCNIWVYWKWLDMHWFVDRVPETTVYMRSMTRHDVLYCIAYT